MVVYQRPKKPHDAQVYCLRETVSNFQPTVV